MQALLVLGLLFAFLVALFAAQNTQPVTVNFLAWRLQTAAVVVVLASASAGALALGLLSLVRWVSTSLRLRSLQAQIQRLRQERDALQQKVAQASPAPGLPGPGGQEDP